MSDDDLVLERVTLYEEALVDRFKFYLENVFFPLINGKNQPVFQKTLDERQQFLLLREVARRAEAVKRGEMESDPETIAFERNLDGAQDRLIQLGQQFSG